MSDPNTENPRESADAAPPAEPQQPADEAPPTKPQMSADAAPPAEPQQSADAAPPTKPQIAGDAAPPAKPQQSADAAPPAEAQGIKNNRSEEQGHKDWPRNKENVEQDKSDQNNEDDYNKTEEQNNSSFPKRPIFSFQFFRSILFFVLGCTIVMDLTWNNGIGSSSDIIQ